MTSSSFTMQTLGFILLVAILLQTVAVAVTFIYFSNALTTMKETFSKSSISCLMRANMRTLRDLDISSEEGNDDPCWQVTQQLHLLMEKTTSNHYQKEISSAVKGEVSRVLPSLTIGNQDSPRPEIAAHLTGNFMASTDEIESPKPRRVQGQKIQSWESERGLAFVHNLILNNGELIIPQAGLYYLYSQTYFRHSLPLDDSEAADNSVKNKQMLQYIYKKASSYPEPMLLMKNARTTCWSKNAEYGLYSIYQAGVFQLNVNDRIFVSVSNISIVDMDAESSFFGAFLVS
ncbi:tumor necrosis factor ligand superfamily member 10 [Lepisosteus oculatus]|nr:PREDICTED: tumor necrosis factor ligand superfamily member 10 [Lepisosteus oculatus]